MLPFYAKTLLPLSPRIRHVHHMLSKCLFLVRWTPFVRSNMWPFTVGAFWLLFLSVRASFVMVALPTDKTCGFGPTRFCRMVETLAIPALLYPNWGPKFFHLVDYTCNVTGQILRISASASASSFISNLNICRTLPSFLLVRYSALA